MQLPIVEEPIERLDEHARISIAFTVQRMLQVSTPGCGLGGIQLIEVDVEAPWVKLDRTVLLTVWGRPATAVAKLWLAFWAALQLWDPTAEAS